MCSPRISNKLVNLTWFMRVFVRSWQDHLSGQLCPRDITDFALLGCLSVSGASVNSVMSRSPILLTSGNTRIQLMCTAGSPEQFTCKSFLKANGLCVSFRKGRLKTSQVHPNWYKSGHSFMKCRYVLHGNCQCISFTENVKFKGWFLRKGRGYFSVHWISIPRSPVYSQLFCASSYFPQAML